MKHMTLAAIAKACNGRYFGSDEWNDKAAAGVVLDSRQVGENDVFIATVGERVDGHQFIHQAFANGALAVICENAPTGKIGPYILVENTFDALIKIAKWYRMQLDIKVVGITGSVGKTSTKEMIANVLMQKYAVCKTEGNLNNTIGLPLKILKIREHHEVAVLEMGIGDFGEMDVLSDIAKPDICVLTNIGQSHLAFLGSKQGVLQAKTEMFHYMKKDGSVCLNGDDEMLATIDSVHGKKPITYGLQANNDIYASAIHRKGLGGSICTIHMGNNHFEAEISLPGDHMIQNALAAVAVAKQMKLSIDEIKTGLNSVKAIGGRSNIIYHNRWTIIDDCYNANPSSMKAAIDLLSHANSRTIAILGDMAELGTDETQMHKEVGAYAALADLDVIICVGRLSSHMRDGAMQANHPQVYYCETKIELASLLPNLLKSQDTILVKASHSMGFETIVQDLFDF